MANVGQPRDPVAEFEFRVACQFAALCKSAQKVGCLLKVKDLPPAARSCAPGMEVSIYQHPGSERIWKATFPGKAGCGPFGFYTPAGDKFPGNFSR